MKRKLRFQKKKRNTNPSVTNRHSNLLTVTNYTFEYSSIDLNGHRCWLTRRFWIIMQWSHFWGFSGLISHRFSVIFCWFSSRVSRAIYPKIIWLLSFFLSHHWKSSRRGRWLEKEKFDRMTCVYRPAMSIKLDRSWNWRDAPWARLISNTFSSSMRRLVNCGVLGSHHDNYSNPKIQFSFKSKIGIRGCCRFMQWDFM